MATFLGGLVVLAAAQIGLVSVLPRSAHPEAVLIGGTLAVYAVGWVRLHRRSVRERVARAGLERELAHARELLAGLQRTGTEDPVTGLANRRRWDAELAAACAEAREQRGTVAVLLLDLDHFKRFNDRHGRPAGDAALRAVGTVLAAQIGDGGLVARLGGDELAVLLPGAGEQRAVELADRLRAEVERLPAAGDVPGAVTVSVGVAVADGARAFPLELMAGADAQLYRAKIIRNTVSASMACRRAAVVGTTVPAPR